MSKQPDMGRIEDERDRIKYLVDQLPEELYDLVGAFMQEVIDRAEKGPDQPPKTKSEGDAGYLRARLLESIDQIERGEGIPHEEIEALMDGWLQE